MTGRASRAKGANAEREVVALLREAGWDVHRSPLSGALEWHPGDVDGFPYFVEVKRCETLRIPEWCAKAEEQAGGEPALLVFRRSREPWRVCMRLSDFLGMMERGSGGLGSA
jgi:Holliday junction resolvase